MHTWVVPLPARSNPPLKGWAKTAWEHVQKVVEKKVGPELMPKLKGKTLWAFGSGQNGAVLPTHTPGIVMKITSDSTEAAFAREMLKKPIHGIVKYHEVLAIPATREGEPIFLLWREEIKPVERLPKAFEDQLHALHDIAQPFSRAWMKYTRKWTPSSDLQSFYGKSPLQLLKIVGKTKETPSALQARQRLAAFQAGLAWMHHEMRNPVTDAMQTALDRGWMLADVFDANVGYLPKTRNMNKSLVIHDPGNAHQLSGIAAARRFLAGVWRAMRKNLGGKR